MREFLVGGLIGLVVGLLLGILLVISELEDNHIGPCELELPRSEKCVITAVPESNIKEQIKTTGDRYDFI